MLKESEQSNMDRVVWVQILQQFAILGFLLTLSKLPCVLLGMFEDVKYGPETLDNTDLNGEE